MQLNLTFTHLRPEYQDALCEKNLDSFDAIERYGRELERREAIKERYRSPRRYKSRIAGTNYTGPHRGTHKAAATVEVLAAEENEAPESEKNPWKDKEDELRSQMNRWPLPGTRYILDLRGYGGLRMGPTKAIGRR